MDIDTNSLIPLYGQILTLLLMFVIQGIACMSISSNHILSYAKPKKRVKQHITVEYSAISIWIWNRSCSRCRGHIVLFYFSSVFPCSKRYCTSTKSAHLWVWHTGSQLRIVWDNIPMEMGADSVNFIMNYRFAISFESVLQLLIDINTLK